tara:strand:- start:449 stop:835 length:387 start_codon:yes stop_codon:yes gene_type:complete
MPQTLITLFNSHIIEFIDDLCNIIDNSEELLNIKSKIKKVILISSSKPIKLWKDTCSKYDIEIENKNYTFFLQKSYIQDVKQDNFLFSLFEKYKTQLSIETTQNKEIIMQYIYNLHKISKMYYMSKTN